MTSTNPALSVAAVAGILAADLILSSGVLAATPPIATSGSTAFQISLNFNPPDRGSPGTTTGGGTRTLSACARGKTPLTLLVPADKAGRFGLTTAARPTLLAFVPRTTARSAEVVLVGKSSQNPREDEEMGRATVPLSGEAGVVSVQLPENTPALAVGKDYQWYFSLICNPNDRSDDIVASAWISRTPPKASLARALERAPLRDRPALYSASSYWYDTLATLMELRQANPKDTKLKNDWAQLLQSVGLKEVAEQPLLLKVPNRAASKP